VGLPTANDWILVNTFAGWLSAIGTLLAVIVSLWLARRDSRICLRIMVGLRKIFLERRLYERPADEPDFLFIGVTNIGRRVATVTGLLWKNRLVRGYLFQMPGEPPISAQIPTTLHDGEEADFVVPMSAFAASSNPADVRRLIPRPRMLTIFFLRMLVRTSTGELFAAPLEKELRKWILSFAEGKHAAGPSEPM
jgi:hypothetical protein